MSCKVLILRPQPGAAETAERARALGLEPIVAPLFTVRAIDWIPGEARDFDAILITSANAARFGGDALAAFTDLPCYAVGARSATAARSAGFSTIRIGPGDASELLGMMAADGMRQVFHPCGRDHIDLAHPDLSVRDTPVYASEASESLPVEAEKAIDTGALVLLHSPRAAEIFADLVGDQRRRIRIFAISPAAAKAAGPGWKSVDAAHVPRDQALLELAAKLCQTGPE